MPSISEAFTIALAHHQAGRIELAEEIFRRIVAAEPNHAAALHGLGVCIHQQGQFVAAADYIGRAVAVSPGDPTYHYSLGEVYRSLQQMPQSIPCYHRAIELRPDYPEAHNSLGVALRRQENLDEAVACFRRAVQLRPNYAEAHNNLGSVLLDQGKRDEAIACFRLAVQLRPDLAEIHCNLGNALRNQGELNIDCFRRALELRPDMPAGYYSLGNVLRDQGKLDEAAACYRRAVQLSPDYPEAHNNLGVVLQDQGKVDEAIAFYHRALVLRPDSAEIRCNLGTVLLDVGKLDEAVACNRRALELHPDFADAHCKLGNALVGQGKVDEAILCYQQAMALNPDDARTHSCCLYALRYDPRVTPAALAEAHAEYDRRHAAGFRAARPSHGNSPEPGRRLRVGFVSPAFCRGPVGSFLIGALEHLDRASCEVLCYSDRVLPDDLTARFRAAAGMWCDACALSDEKLAERIRADRVDVLFDLAGHTPRNRLLALARKPAPIQITWIDSVGTTGVSAIDYVLADPCLIPPGAETCYTERVLRMPDDYVCYDPPAAAGAVGPLPAARQGYVTFGSFSRPAKISPQVVRVWSCILRRVGGSKLVLKYQGFDDPGTMDHFRRRFAAQGVDPARLELQGYSSLNSYFDEYGRIDVTLDPFPHSGGLTTCDSLWMGVPVVTWPGETFAGRQSLSHLFTVGLTETIASSPDEYVDLAVKLADDLPRLAEIRARLRPQMAASPLCDANRFAGNLMQLLRRVWRDGCNAGSNASMKHSQPLSSPARDDAHTAQQRPTRPANH